MHGLEEGARQITLPRVLQMSELPEGHPDTHRDECWIIFVDFDDEAAVTFAAVECAGRGVFTRDHAPAEGVLRIREQVLIASSRGECTSFKITERILEMHDPRALMIFHRLIKPHAIDSKLDHGVRINPRKERSGIFNLCHPEPNHSTLGVPSASLDPGTSHGDIAFHIVTDRLPPSRRGEGH